MSGAKKPVFKISFPCGCKYVYDWGSPYDELHFEFCDKHNSEWNVFVKEHHHEIFSRVLPHNNL